MNESWVSFIFDHLLIMLNDIHVGFRQCWNLWFFIGPCIIFLRRPMFFLLCPHWHGILLAGVIPQRQFWPAGDSALPEVFHLASQQDSHQQYLFTNTWPAESFGLALGPGQIGNSDLSCSHQNCTPSMLASIKLYASTPERTG